MKTNNVLIGIVSLLLLFIIYFIFFGSKGVYRNYDNKDKIGLELENEIKSDKNTDSKNNIKEEVINPDELGTAKNIKPDLPENIKGFEDTLEYLQNQKD